MIRGAGREEVCCSVSSPFVAGVAEVVSSGDNFSCKTKIKKQACCILLVKLKVEQTRKDLMLIA